MNDKINKWLEIEYFLKSLYCGCPDNDYTTKIDDTKGVLLIYSETLYGSNQKDVEWFNKKLQDISGSSKPVVWEKYFRLNKPNMYLTVVDIGGKKDEQM